MRSTEIVFFCSLYLLFFFVIGNLAGIASFPPQPQWVGIEVWEIKAGFYLSFWEIATILAVIVSILVITFAAGIKIFGSGVTFNQAFVVTIAISLFFGGLLAWTMTAMLVGVPTLVSAILVWPFIIALVYSIISMSRGGGEG